MPTSKTSLDFKLIAVRVLPDCVQHIRKCLVENHFYYLNNDYRISEDGKLITRRSVSIGESRIVRLDKVSYLCTMILNYSNYGTRQETIKQQAKVRRGCNR